MTLFRSTLPAAYLSLWFEDPDVAMQHPRDGRSPKRTFTVRTASPEDGTMTVDFVLHGSGPASTWAERAKVGDAIWAGETRSGWEVPPSGSHLVLVGDDTALPAIGAIAEATPDDVRITTIAEVVDGLDERVLSDTRVLDPIWLHRGKDPSNAGAPTVNLLETLVVPDDAHWWVAGERDAILSMRDLIVGTRGVPPERFSLNAYWRLVTTDPRRR
jgi:NADPH-dependent ferric siderophore reductase